MATHLAKDTADGPLCALALEGIRACARPKGVGAAAWGGLGRQWGDQPRRQRASHMRTHLVA